MAAQDYPIHYYSGRQDAPILTGQIGTLGNLLYKCLVDGFNSQTATSALTRSGSTVTFTKSGHGFTDYDRVVIAGANESEYNGSFQVLPGATSSTFQYTIVGSPNSPSTGTVTAKFQPLGWTRELSSGNKSIFKNNATTGSGCEFRLNDSGAGTQSYRTAFIRGSYGHTDIDTLTYPVFPNTTQMAGEGLVIHKSTTLDATAREWDIYGNGRFFLFMAAYHASYPGVFNCVFFGDVITATPSPAYPACIQALPSETMGAINYFHRLTSSLTSTQPGKYMATGYNQTGDPVALGTMGMYSISSTMGQGGMPSPNPASNGYSMSHVYLNGQNLILARIPGIFQLWHDLTESHRSLLPAFPSLPGRRIKVFASGGPTIGDTGRIALDLTGPLYD